MLGRLLLLANSTMGRNECDVLNGRDSHSKAPKMIINRNRENKIFIGLTHFQRSPDRSPVVSLGIFSEASDKSVGPGSTQPFEMSTRIFLGVKTAGT
jgi:hypothetical protein